MAIPFLHLAFGIFPPTAIFLRLDLGAFLTCLPTCALLIAMSSPVLARPITSRHLAWRLRVALVSGAERLAPSRLTLLDLHIFVAIADDFFFSALACLDHKLLFGVARRSLWLVARHGLLIDPAALFVIQSHYLRCLAVFLATFFGWLECCLPFFVSARFLRLVAAYSCEDRDFIAFSGRYRSPVAFLP